jgi:hypothetical protein
VRRTRPLECDRRRIEASHGSARLGEPSGKAPVAGAEIEHARRRLPPPPLQRDGVEREVEHPVVERSLGGDRTPDLVVIGTGNRLEKQH